MENNWTKRLLACILSLALVLLALPAGIGGAFQASASAPSTTDPYASVDEATMIAGQNLGILGNENRLMEWEYDQNVCQQVHRKCRHAISNCRNAICNYPQLAGHSKKVFWNRHVECF